MKYFGAAVQATIPEPVLWRFEYLNWWGHNETVVFRGTEKECLREQGNVEASGWDAYCQGYGPDRALTKYIGPDY